jgi:hypothetical protein
MAGAAHHSVSPGAGRVNGRGKEADLLRGKHFADLELIDNHPFLDFGFQRRDFALSAQDLLGIGLGLPQEVLEVHSFNHQIIPPWKGIVQKALPQVLKGGDLVS